MKCRQQEGGFQDTFCKAEGTEQFNADIEPAGGAGINRRSKFVEQEDHRMARRQATGISLLIR